MTAPIRVLIADDHPLFCDGLATLLTDGPGTELAGAATTGTEAVDLARETRPDVVLMDLHMPGMNGIEATRRIAAGCPHAAVLVIIFSAQPATRMLACFTAAAPSPPFPQLTGREREVLDLLAQGRANLAIATRLSLSPKTVRNHVSSILAKLQVTDRAQAIIQARDAGLGQVSRT